MARHVIVFPEPDSPTSANVSPGRTSKLTPRTAWTVPRRVGISTRRFSTVSRGSLTVGA